MRTPCNHPEKDPLARRLNDAVHTFMFKVFLPIWTILWVLIIALAIIRWLRRP